MRHQRLFPTAGLKETLWPKVLAVGGIVIMVVGGVANAHRARRRLSRDT